MARVFADDGLRARLGEGATERAPLYSSGRDRAADRDVREGDSLTDHAARDAAGRRSRGTGCEKERCESVPFHRHSRSAQRRQVDALHGADPKARRRRELPVRHDRAERRHRAGARRPPRPARRDRPSRRASCRRSSSSSTSRGSSQGASRGRGAGQPVPRQHPARPTRSSRSSATSRIRTSARRRRESIRTRDAQIDPAPSSCWPTSARWRRRCRGWRRKRSATRRSRRSSTSARACRPGWRRARRAADMEMTDEERRLLYDLHLLTMKPMLYVANVDEADVDEGTARDRRRQADPDLREGRGRAGRARSGRGSGVPGRARAGGARAQHAHPRGVPAARAALVLHGGADGGARLDGAHRREGARGRRRHPHGLREGLHQGRGDRLRGLRPARAGRRAPRRPASCASKGARYVVADGDVMHFRFNV